LQYPAAKNFLLPRQSYQIGKKIYRGSSCLPLLSTHFNPIREKLPRHRKNFSPVSNSLPKQAISKQATLIFISSANPPRHFLAGYSI
jgi:hypothetical protein